MMCALGRPAYLSRRNVVRGRAQKIFFRRSEGPGDAPSRNDLRRGGHARPKRLSATCNEAEYGRREALRAADSALRDANAARNIQQPLMRILLEPQSHLGVCVYGLG